jgi:hypothetical protein
MSVRGQCGPPPTADTLTEHSAQPLVGVWSHLVMGPPQAGCTHVTYIFAAASRETCTALPQTLSLFLCLASLVPTQYSRRATAHALHLCFQSRRGIQSCATSGSQRTLTRARRRSPRFVTSLARYSLSQRVVACDAHHVSHNTHTHAHAHTHTHTHTHTHAHMIITSTTTHTTAHQHTFCSIQHTACSRCILTRYDTSSCVPTARPFLHWSDQGDPRGAWQG